MKKTIQLLILSVMLFSLVGCENFLGPMGFLGSDENPSNKNNSNSLVGPIDEPIEEPIAEPVTEPVVPEGSVAEEPKKDGYWELYDSKLIVPQNQTIGDGNPTIEYDFSSSKTSIGLNTVRTGKDGSTERIQTYGSWSVPEEVYFAEHTIRINLEAGVTSFNKVWTNFIGVAVYAYLGSENTPFGQATEKALRDDNGIGTCRATIDDGKITVAQANKEVSITVHEGSANQKMVIFVVASNQGYQGGVMYYYAWKDW